MRVAEHPRQAQKIWNNPWRNTLRGYKTRIKGLENCKLVQSFWRAAWRLATKVVKVFLAFDPIILLLGIYTMKITEKQMDTICKKMFIVALFIIGKPWKLPKCSTAGEWLSKLWDINMVEYYITISNDKCEFSIHEKVYTDKC